MNKELFVYLVTGGTGFVGSFLGVELLKQGHFVFFLARGKGNLSAQERIDTALAFADKAVSKSTKNKYRVIEGDVTAGENLGLAPDVIEQISRVRPKAVFHSAGSVDFSENNKEKTFKTNIEGTRNVLEFARIAGIEEFNHLSTLYVAGNRKGDIHEDELDVGQGFNNPYEKSKLEAEKLVRAFPNYRVFRLPIVIGDSRTGKTSTYTGFYGFFKPFSELKEGIRRRGNDQNLAKANIRIESDGEISLPLFVKCAEESRIDLVTVDWVVETIQALSAKEKAKNMTFHLCHPSPPSSREVIEMALPIIGLKGLNFISVNGKPTEIPQHEDKTLKVYQRMVDSIIGRYFAYSVCRLRFVGWNIVDVLGEYKKPPKIDGKLLELLLSFAEKERFKKQSFA